MPAVRKRGGGYSMADKIIDLTQEQPDEVLSRKYIRNTGKFGGMVSYDKHYNSPPPQEIMEEIQMSRPRTPIHILQDVPPQPLPQPQQQPQSQFLSCIDVCNHIDKCPICSKLYNNDKTLYVITIIILVIVCILLLKKLIEK